MTTNQTLYSICHHGKMLQIRVSREPLTLGLSVRCSTDCLTGAHMKIIVYHQLSVLELLYLSPVW